MGSAIDWVEEAAKDVGDVVVDTANTVGDVVVDTANTVAEEVTDAGNSFVNGAVSAWAATSDQAKVLVEEAE